MARPRRGALVALGLLLTLGGAASAYGLGAIVRAVGASEAVQTPPTRAQVREIAGHAAATLFRGDQVLARYIARVPVRLYSSQGTVQSTSQFAVVLVLGRAGRAVAVARAVFGPYNQAVSSLATSGVGWTVPFASAAPSKGTLEALGGLPAPLQTRVDAWLGSQGGHVLAFGAWPFPQGTLVVAQFPSGPSVALFPPSGAPRRIL